MGAERRRYTAKAFPSMAGDTVSRSFRLPVAVDALLTAEIEKGKPGIASRTDALQDAVVVWLMLEGVEDAG
jgi:hypothetical protein